MHINLTLNDPTFNFHAAPTAMSSAFIAALLSGCSEQEPREGIDPNYNRPAIGEYWHGQGGVFAGDFRGDDGSIFGLIVAQEQDIGSATWGPNGSRNDLSDWDGLANTKAMCDRCPAAKLAAGYTRDEHSDFYLPARRELLIGAGNLHDTFGKERWYWTSTPRAEHYAWAVDFESGTTLFSSRFREFRVRPFRRFIY